MPGSATDHLSTDLVVTHPLDAEGAAITAAMRAMTSGAKGIAVGTEARGQFDAVMESVLPRDDVSFEAGTLGDVPGIWVRPLVSRPGDTIFHLHGGWFNFGSANAYRHLVGHLAARAEAAAFIPDYRLAPEHPFPAATDACYRALAETGGSRIVLTGDSAGGNLALGLGARVTSGTGSASVPLVGIAVFSPITDLTLSGTTYETRAEADPLFTRSQVAALVRAYLNGADPTDPFASPLNARLSAMPAVRIHVGDDEVLLADSVRYVERAAAAGVYVRLDVWLGMPHGFVGSVGKMKAAAQALDAVGAFLVEKLRAHADA